MKFKLDVKIFTGQDGDYTVISHFGTWDSCMLELNRAMEKHGTAIDYLNVQRVSTLTQ